MIELSLFVGAYAKLIDGVVSEIVSKPDWLHLDGTPITDDEAFKEDAIWPIIDQKPEYNRYIQSCTLNDRKSWLVEGSVITTYTIEDLPLATSKSIVGMELDRIRDSKIFCGDIPYVFPGDIEPDHIQMRHESDRQNLRGFIQGAIASIGGDTLYFRPSSNNLKAMTREDVLDMSRFLEQRDTAIRNRTWQFKDLLSEAETLNEVAALVNNFTNNWI